jgi:predicted ester cyclase
MGVNSVEANKAIMRSIVENNDARTFYAYMDSVSEDFVGHTAFVPGDLHGNRALSEFFYLTEEVAFPDGVHEIRNLFGEDDMVTLELSYTGTFTGPLPNGTPPNGKRIEFRYNIVCRFADGKLAELWWYSYDSFTLMKELGMF